MTETKTHGEEPVLPAVVFVATPLIGRDAQLVAGWAAAIDSIAKASPGFVFLKCAAVREGDSEAAQACASAGVDTVGIPWYDLPPATAEGHSRKNRVGVLLKRVRLVKAALAANAAIIWFVNIDVRVGTEHWEAADRIFQSGRGVALIPYPTRWLAGHAPVVCLATPSATGVKLEVHDARRFRAAEGLEQVTSAIVAGGGMGCTAILAPIAALVPFIVREQLLTPEVIGQPKPRPHMPDESGWFVNAARAGVEIRMPLGVVADHLGCEPSIEAPYSHKTEEAV